MRRALDRVRDARGDDGFTLVELIVAIFVIGGVLLALMAVQISALTTTIHGKQRQQGTAIANLAMEELRALPWATLSRGIHSSFQAVASDPFVSGTTLAPHFDTSLDEPLVTTDSTIVASPNPGPGQIPPAPPLYDLSGSNVTIVTDPAVPDVEFVVRSYVTRSDQIPDHAVNLAVIVSWTPASTDEERHVIVRSTAYSASGGCGQASQTPFLGACQAMLDADAGAGAASVSFSGFSLDLTDDEAPLVPTELLPGASTARAEMTLSSTSATLTSFQAANMWGRVTSAGTSQSGDEADDVDESGRVVAANAASTDVGAAGAAPPNPGDLSAVPGDTSTRMIDGDGGMRLRLTPPTSLTGKARTLAAGSCFTGVPADQPCAIGDVSWEDQAFAELLLPGGDFRPFQLSRGLSGEAWAARFYPPTTSTGGGVGCSTVADAGCIAAGASRSFGDLHVGPGTWEAVGGGATTNALATLTGYQDRVAVEHGPANGSVAPEIHRSGTLQYWNGSTMSTLSLAPGGPPQSVTIPPVEREIGGRTVIASGTIEIFPASSSRTGTDPACRAEGCGVTAEIPSVSMAINYMVVDGDEAHVLAMNLNLNGVRASAKYKAEPDS